MSRSRGPRRALQGARTVLVPAAAVGALVAAADAAFTAEDFRVRRRPDVSGVRAVYHRGSTAEDLTIFASGIESLTHKIGPFSALGVVVLWVAEAPADEGPTRAVLSMIRGYDLRAEFTSATDAMIASLTSSGVALQDEGWQHAVLLPEDCPANPKTAKTLGLR